MFGKSRKPEAQTEAPRMTESERLALVEARIEVERHRLRVESQKRLDTEGLPRYFYEGDAR